MKKLIALVLICTMALSLAACGSSDSGMKDDSAVLVQGNLDEVYLGKFDEDYMKMVNSTVEACEENYLAGMEFEADYFIYYFEIEHSDEALRAEIAELYKEIYSYSKYTVGASSKLDEDTYVVKVQIQPIDIFQQVMDAWDAGMASFWEKYADVDISAMSEEEYKQFDADWARSIIDLVKSKMANVGYLEEQSIAVQIVRDENDVWSISDTDFDAVDNAIIYYP